MFTHLRSVCACVPAAHFLRQLCLLIMVKRRQLETETHQGIKGISVGWCEMDVTNDGEKVWEKEREWVIWGGVRLVKGASGAEWWRDPSKDRWEWDYRINTIQGCLVINAYREEPAFDTPHLTAHTHTHTHTHTLLPVLLSPFPLSNTLFHTLFDILFNPWKYQRSQNDSLIVQSVKQFRALRPPGAPKVWASFSTLFILI